MTINKRIRDFRKNKLKINQRQFAADLGMAQTGISSMEQDGATVTDRAIKSICMAYGVNENWLRNGIEPIYIQTPTFSLDDFMKQHGATDFELQIAKAYFELDQDTRKKLIDHFKNCLANSSSAEPAVSSEPTTEDKIQKELDEYRAELELEARQAEKSEVSGSPSEKEAREA